MFNKIIKIQIAAFIALLIIIFSAKQFFFNNEEKSNTNDEKKAVTNTIQKPKIAILISDVGLMRDTTKKAFASHEKIAIGITPYADNVTKLTQESIDNGHNTLVLLPTQQTNSSREDSGPLAMSGNLNIEENALRFTNIMNIVISDNISLYLPPATIFSVKEERAIILINLLENYQSKFKYIAYIDSERATQLTKLSMQSSIKDKIILIDTILDEYLTEDEIIENLNQLAILSDLRNDIAVGMIENISLSIDTVNTWLRDKISNGEIELLSFDEVIELKKSRREINDKE